MKKKGRLAFSFCGLGGGWVLFVLVITGLLVGSLSLAGAVQAGSGSKLIIFSWWTAGGETDALQALLDTYRENEPEVEVVNVTIAGGAGTNAKGMLKARMLSGEPVDSFQVHAGSELIDSWVKTGFLQPITDLWVKNRWFDVFPPQLVEMLSYKEEVYAVPVGVHRGNVLWYNRTLLMDYGLSPPRTFDEFFAVAETLRQQGIVPLAVASKNKWPVTHLFESILVGAGGPQFYRDLMAGKIPWNDTKVKETLRILEKMMGYANLNHPVLTWDQACEAVLKGDAAMTIMGDWAKGYFTARGAIPGHEYDMVPAPNTKGIFIVIIDTFVLTKEAPHRENALAWLETVGGVEGQMRFNQIKGSIPPRLDVPMGAFDELARRARAAFFQDELVFSFAHSSVTSDAFVSAVNDELAAFIHMGDIDYTAARLDRQAEELGIRTGTK